MKEKELLKTVRHIALATVNEDGTPHNTPLFFIYNNDFTKFYMSTHPSALHSKNVERTGKGYVVVYDSEVFKGGLYLTLRNFKQVGADDLHEAMEVYNQTRLRWGMEALPDEHYQEPNERRLYVADIHKIEIYGAHEDKNAKILNEYRIEISAEEILNG